MIVPMSQVESKEIAFYYPGPMWHHDDWIKTMILFFDGIGILLPDYLNSKPEREDPAIAIPLREQGLLHILEPEQIVDKAATEKLSAAMTEVINSGVLDKLDKNGEFHEISYSRMGGYGEEQLAKQLLETLKAKGLARDSEDGKSIPMQPMVRSLILVLLSQILRPHGEKLGAELSPATDRPQLVQALRSCCPCLTLRPLRTLSRWIWRRSPLICVWSRWMRCWDSGRNISLTTGSTFVGFIGSRAILLHCRCRRARMSLLRGKKKFRRYRTRSRV